MTTVNIMILKGFLSILSILTLVSSMSIKEFFDQIEKHKPVVLPNSLVIERNMTSFESNGLQEGARIEGAEMNGTQMNGTQMNGAQMDGAQMDGAQMNGAQMDGAQMNGAQMNGTQTDTARMDTAQRESSKSSKKSCNHGHDFWDSLYSALTGSASCGLIAFLVKLYKYINKKCFEKVQNDLISNI